MRKFITGILIVGLYCFPFVYFSMHQDFTNGSMFGYLIMIVGTSLLAFLSRYFSNTIPFIIGNVASFIISFYFLSKMEATLGVGWDDGYFKPLTPYQLLFLVSFLNLIPQLLVMSFANRMKKR
ncbi:hypothetical protein [Lentibacillus saliphilus]|uniref:hypothetical protein n=1 Tax=Lentibacillus saliphilus TaxID=2737028 RepID=UPI001C30CB18|nr:hypothetical protein [Lentibacillus saliphilus]